MFARTIAAGDITLIALQWDAPTPSSSDVRTRFYRHSAFWHASERILPLTHRDNQRKAGRHGHYRRFQQQRKVDAPKRPLLTQPTVQRSVTFGNDYLSLGVPTVLAIRRPEDPLHRVLQRLLESAQQRGHCDHPDAFPHHR